MFASSSSLLVGFQAECTFFLLQATWVTPEPQKLLKFFAVFTLKVAWNTNNFSKFDQKTVEKKILSNRWFLSLKSCYIFQGPEHWLLINWLLVKKMCSLFTFCWGARVSTFHVKKWVGFSITCFAWSVRVADGAGLLCSFHLMSTIRFVSPI